MDGATETLIKSSSTPLATKSTPPTMAPGTEAERQRRVPYLAPELTDTIIDHLWNDRPTLLRTALVARQFRDASQHHLFSSIHLSGVAASPSRCRGVEAFIALCQNSGGRIGRYVREVEVAGDRWYGHAPSARIRRACLGPKHLNELVRMPFLRRLTLTSVVWDREAVADTDADSETDAYTKEASKTSTEEDVHDPSTPGLALDRTPHTTAAFGQRHAEEHRERDHDQGQGRHKLDTLTLSHFTSFGSVCASLQDIHALLAAFGDIGELHLLRTSVRLDGPVAVPLLPLSTPLVNFTPMASGLTPIRVQSIELGPTSRSAMVYAALSQLRVCASLERLKVELGDWTLIPDLALFLRDAAHGVQSLELDVSTCRSAWVDDEPEELDDGASLIQPLVPIL